MRNIEDDYRKESFGFIRIGQWVKVKGGRVEEVMERMTAGKQGAQLFRQELQSKGRHEKTSQNHTQPSTAPYTYAHKYP